MTKELWRVVVIAVAMVLALPALAVAAQTEGEPALSLTTPYPGVAVEAGEQASFDLVLQAPAGQQVALEVTTVPEGWTATITGGGFVVDRVTAAETPPALRLDVNVPPEAAEGDYELAVEATTDGATATLPIDVRVSATAGGTVSLVPEFPELQGPTDATFTFNLTLQNDTPNSLEMRLATEAPPGWQAEASPSGESQASTVVVDAGSSERITVDVTPPPAAAAQAYPIVVSASGGGSEARAELVVHLVGSFDIGLTTPDGRLNADVTAGEASEMSLLVTNPGTARLTNVTVSVGAPAGWDVVFDTETIPEIAPGESAPVTASITPSEDAVAGDYVITFRASNEAASASSEVRATVSPSPLWGLVGIGLIALTLAGLALVFRRFGRR